MIGRGRLLAVKRSLCITTIVVSGLLVTGPGCTREAPPLLGEVDVSNPLLRELGDEDVLRLERHLRSSPRWEVREERGSVFAVRREQRDGAFTTSLNGYYSASPGEELVQTRVLLGFGPPPKNAPPHANVVRAGEGTVTLRAAPGSNSQSSFTSWLRLLGRDDRARGGLYLEIMEDARTKERHFTRAALAQVHEELAQVLKAAEVLDREGYVPALWPDGDGPARGAPKLEVTDGMQPGIYVATAWVNPGERGKVYLRVFHEGPLPTRGAAAEEVTEVGQRLSAERVTGRTTQLTGWSNDADRLFPYQSEVTVYEGDWDEDYRARFELRFVNEQGAERTLATASRTINGWMR